MWGQQREVFPGLDSGPNDSEGHYSMTLEKRPSADPTYTTSIVSKNAIRNIGHHVREKKCDGLKLPM